MAIITINVNSNYSAIKASLASGDTIRIGTNTVRLTIDEQPLLTGIIVDSPGISGRMTVSGAYDLSTWAIIAGTVALIDGTFPSGATLGSATGGSGSSSFGINRNDGTVTTATGGNATNAHGISLNTGTAITANGGSHFNAHGISVNEGLVTNANGGTTAASDGITTNSRTVIAANGGAVSGAMGVTTNNGTVEAASGGTAVGAFGINTNNGQCLRLADNTEKSVNSWIGSLCFVEGQFINGTIPANIKDIRSQGKLSVNAIIASDAIVTELLEGSGGFPLSRVLN